MFLLEWREFPSAPCLAGKENWWELASRCCWNRMRTWHASELLSFLVFLRTFQHPGKSFYYILLYFTIFYYILLYFTIFYYILLYFTIFYYILTELLITGFIFSFMSRSFSSNILCRGEDVFLTFYSVIFWEHGILNTLYCKHLFYYYVNYYICNVSTYILLPLKTFYVEL